MHNLLRKTSSYTASSFCEVWLKSYEGYGNYGRYTKLVIEIKDLWQWPWPLRYKPDSYAGHTLLYCFIFLCGLTEILYRVRELWLISKWMTSDQDLDLWDTDLILMHDTPSHIASSLCWFHWNPIQVVEVMAETEINDLSPWPWP